jgi:general stress protein 26
MSSAKEKVLKILDKKLIGTLSTVSNNKPHSRYMTFYNDNFTLYCATSKDTHKVEELQQNPYTHILLGLEGVAFGNEYLEIEGTVEVTQDDSMREKVWNKYMEFWFDGPEDPDLVILKISPSSIRIMNKKGNSPEVVEL